MSKSLDAERLDVVALAHAGGVLEGASPLQKYERLAQEDQALQPDSMVNWRLQGEIRRDSGGTMRPALHVQASAQLHLLCQRCLAPVVTPVQVDRHLLFVPDEATASLLDEESEDDVLVAQPALTPRALVEDELVMALPLVARHDVCPAELPRSDTFTDGIRVRRRAPTRLRVWRA